MPPIGEMVGIKKLTNTEKNQAIQYLKDQSKKPRNGPAQPIKAKSQKPCFIATAVYGNPGHSQVKSLRGYRDNVLNNNPVGRFLIWAYYLVSPRMAGLINRFPGTRRPLKYLLDSFVSHLDHKYKKH